MKKLLIHKLIPVFGVLLFLVALWILHHEVAHYRFSDVRAYLHGLPGHRVLWAIGLTCFAYLVLTGYDVLSFRYVGKPLKYPRTAFASFISYAFSMNIGQSLVSGGSVRLRLYSAWGFSAVDITKIVVFCPSASLIGLSTLGGILFVFHPLTLPTGISFPLHSVRMLGILLLTVPLVLIAISLFRKAPFTIRSWKVDPPSLSLSLAMIVVSALDWGLAGSTLFVLLPPNLPISFFGILEIYLLAQIVGIVSQVPGGIGVFETVFLLLLPGAHSSPSVLGGLLAFRGIYYLLPFMGAVLLMGSHEALSKREYLNRYSTLLGRWLGGVVPQVLSVGIFLAGAILLLSGATPAMDTRLKWLDRILPLSIIEISHFLASLIGAAFLILAREMKRRVDVAYFLTLFLLATGIIFSLLKGFDYEEATILLVLLLALLPCRSHFTRKASLIQHRFDLGWWALILIVLFCSLWLGLFSYKHVDYSHDLWWHFSLRANAPRFLRAFVGVITLILIYGMGQLLRPVFPEPHSPSPEEKEQVLGIVQKSNLTSSWLALLGDKRFLFSTNQDAFLMYGVEGRTWVVMGDPIGPEKEWEGLIWQFFELCDHYGGRPAFYQVNRQNLHYYVDMGLTFYKLGEEGRVSLNQFALEGKARKGLRYSHNKMVREGCSFEVLPVEETIRILPVLHEISDAWLTEKHTREKGFSLGRFEESYLCHFPTAIVWLNGKRIAFANIWPGADKTELTIDLMRYQPGVPEGAMEYLFVEIMLWGAREGYQWFSLGMAPLAGLENRPLSPLWNRIGAAVFRHGEHFYNFQGLRSYKEKFDPVWEDRYLACPGGFTLSTVLLNIASLISGGLSGVIVK